MRQILAIVLTLCFTLSAARAQSDQQLVDRYDQLISSKNYDAALNIAGQITDRYPDSALWQFNLGTMHARAGNNDEAIGALSRAAGLGYTGVRSFEQYEDLDPLREDERFIRVLDKVRANAQARLDGFIEDAKNHTPQIHLPPSLPDSPALIIALHGTGMQGRQMIQALQDAADELNMILIAPDAIRPTAGGYAWTYRDESEWLVKHTIENAIEEHHVDPDRIFLVGFSQGANIALVMGQTDPDLFAGVVPICGHYEPQIASAEDESRLPPFYLMTGARDPWKKTYAQAKKDFTAANASVQIKILPSQGHELPAGATGTRELVRAIRWCENQP